MISSIYHPNTKSHTMDTISAEKKNCNKDEYTTTMHNIESTLMHDGIGEDDPNYSRSSISTSDARNLYSAEEEEDGSSSLYFPLPANDNAHGIHATDDPPMWGDNLEDLNNEELLNFLLSVQNDDINIGGKSSSDLNTTTTDDFKDTRDGGDQPVAGGDSFIDFYKDCNEGGDTDLPIHMDTLEDNIMGICKDGNLFNGSHTMSNSSKGSVETLETPENTTEEEEDDDDEEEEISLQEPTSPARCLSPTEKKQKHALDNPPSEPEDVPVVTPQALRTSASSMLAPGHSLNGASKSLHTPPVSPTGGNSLNDAPKICSSTPSGSPPPPELSTFKPFMRRRVSQASTSSCGSINNHDEIAKAKNHNDIWQQRFAELEEFTRLNGHCNVPQKYDKNPCLGSWVSRQRTIMREFEEDPQRAYYDRIISLKSLGLKPSVGRGKGKRMSYSNWDTNFADLIKYRDTHGHCDVNTKTSSLGRWVGGQRNLYKKHNETGNRGKCIDHDVVEKRFQKLKDAGFKFSIGKGSGRKRGKDQDKR